MDVKEKYIGEGRDLLPPFGRSVIRYRLPAMLMVPSRFASPVAKFVKVFQHNNGTQGTAFPTCTGTAA